MDQIPVFKVASGRRLVKIGVISKDSCRGAFQESVLMEPYYGGVDGNVDIGFGVALVDYSPKEYITYGGVGHEQARASLFDNESDSDGVPMTGACNFGNTEGLRRSIAVEGDSYALENLWFHGFRASCSWKDQKGKWKWMEKRRMRRLAKEKTKNSAWLS